MGDFISGSSSPKFLHSQAVISAHTRSLDDRCSVGSVRGGGARFLKKNLALIFFKKMGEGVEAGMRWSKEESGGCLNTIYA